MASSGGGGWTTFVSKSRKRQMRQASGSGGALQPQPRLELKVDLQSIQSMVWPTRTCPHIFGPLVQTPPTIAPWRPTQETRIKQANAGYAALSSEEQVMAISNLAGRIEQHR